MQPIRTCIIVTIGDELLIGQTIDTNSAWIGQQLSRHGVDVIERVAISDERHQIITTIEHVLTKADIVLVTGGLGPTKDDITKESLAELAGVEMVWDEEMWQEIQAFFQDLGRTTTDAHREQCYMPAGITKLTNKMGTAPGMLFTIKGKVLVSMPGVPYEMKYIMKHGVLPIINDRADRAIIHHTIQTIGKGESRIAEEIGNIVDRLPDHISMAYLPSLGNVRLRLSARGGSAAQLHSDIKPYATEIVDRLGSVVFGVGDVTIEQALAEVCLRHGVKICTAESCTGGHIASRIVKVPGSSAYFMGGLVAYHNSLKTRLLHVKEETLSAHGAVSEETVSEMVAGAVAATGSDVCVAVSGIAGPGGGTSSKPVGTIWLAVGNAGRVETRLLRTGKDRAKNIAYTSTIALDMFRQFILKHYR